MDYVHFSEKDGGGARGYSPPASHTSAMKYSKTSISIKEHWNKDTAYYYPSYIEKCSINFGNLWNKDTSLIRTSGVARGGPSRARPDQLRYSKTLILLNTYDPCKQMIWFYWKSCSFPWKLRENSRHSAYCRLAEYSIEMWGWVNWGCGRI